MSENNPPIAVVGVSTLFPGSIDSTGFWKDILAGTDLITAVPATHWLVEDYYDADPSAPDKTYANRGAFVPEVDFDPMEWGVPPSTVAATDTCQLLALIVAQRVLADAAKGQFKYENRERTSVILGVTSAQELLGAMVSRLQRPVWTKSLREMGLGEDEVADACDRIEAHYTPWQEATFPGVLGNVVAGRIANRLDLGGTNCVTDAACASTFSALTMGINELRLGDSDVVICGGADTMNDIFMYLCFSKTPALSKTGDCRPFSADADGTMLGEGLGMVALKRLADAERDGDRIYAVIRGVGSSSDGKGTAVYAPVASGQAKAVRRAYERAGFGADTVELVEAHGTGTIAGDAAEFEGLRTVFEESGRTDRQWCALGSVKSQIGHTKAAAGAAGMVKTIFALQHRVLPPTIKVNEPNPKLNLPQSPFHLSTRARPWISGAGHPRRAGVSSFGFGGSNFHVVLEEYRGPGLAAYRRRAAEVELIVLHAGSPAALAAEARRVAGDAQVPGMFAFLARGTQERYDACAACRLAVIAKDGADLHVKLLKAAVLVEQGEPFATPDGVSFGMGALGGDVGFLFPGQGSQYLDMGASVAMTWDRARQPWDEAATLDVLDTPLHEVVFPRPAFDEEAKRAQVERLTATEWAQPAIGLTSLSYLALLDLLGVAPAAVAGHSFGEVIALHAAGVVSRRDAIRIARRRGELMAQAASTPGAMTAVTAPVDVVRAKLDEWRSEVVLANHNGPTQVVLSGPLAAIEDVEAKLSAAKLPYRRLPVATAFHSSVVRASTAPFAEFLDSIAFDPPSRPIYGNTEAAIYPIAADAARALLANQLAEPVRFAESIEAMYEAGVRVFLEVGPGSVLTGLTGAILADRPHAAVALDRKNRDGLTSLSHALGHLVAAGVPLDLAALWSAFEPVDDPRTTKKPKLTLKISGTNYGKPYPPEEGAAGIPRPNPTRSRPPAPMSAAERSPATMEAQTMPQPPGPATRSPARAAPATAGVSAAPAVAPPIAAQPIAAQPIAAQPIAAQPIAAQPVAPQADAWASAYYAIQARVIDAHTAYTQAIAATHGAFLTAQQHALSAIPAMMSGQPIVAPVAPQPWPAAAAMPAAPPMREAPRAPAPIAPAPVACAAPPPPPPRTATPAAAGDDSADLPALMLAVVAEKTGYPLEMLDLSMDLEGDLGVDSIKRVEILAEMRERARDLPELDPAEIGKLRTLAEIVARMDVAVPGAVAPKAPRVPSVPSAQPLDLTALMLEVVALKTGYPVEMLELTMDLEGDLGVDSIKRVEILAEIRERASSLPEIDPAELGKLRTLAEIVERLDVAAPARARAADPGDASAPTVDLKALMLEVVAQKTGYPVEMLELGMDLEGDLGVDSIKRVEILAEMRERAPSLPEVDPAELGKMRTLAEIVERMSGQGGGRASTARSSLPIATPAATRWTLRLEAAPASGFALGGLLGCKSIAVVDGGSGLAERLALRLARSGVAARALGPDPTTDGVIFLGGLAELAGIDDALRIQREAFEVAKTVAVRLCAGPGVFVTVQDTGGDFGLGGLSGRAWLGGLPGLVKTAAQEWPEARVRAIDLERGGRSADDLADALADELLRGGSPRRDRASGGGAEVALRADGGRFTLLSLPKEVRAGEARIGKRSVILASGGARGVTANTLIALAASSGARFVLLGRTEVVDEPAFCARASTDAEIKRVFLDAAQAAGERIAPKELESRAQRVLAGREVRATLAAIEGAGGQARYVAADVEDAAAIRAALAPIREAWGPITGIVHGAGVLADRVIADKSRQDFDRVFDVKVRGLRTLLEVTADDPLSVLVTFSSVAGRCGNRGQCDYAMANETLNKVAASEAARRGGTLFARSLGWGPWEGGMVTPALRQHFERLGVPLIALEAGARMLVEELGDTSGSIELVLGGEPRPEALASISAAKPRDQLFEVLIDRDAFPAIADHRVKGQPVLPVALVLELFARAVEATRPDLVFTSCEELSVLRGVVLERYEAQGDRLTVSVSQVSNGDGVILRLQLLDGEGRARYSARGFAERKGATLEILPERPQGLARLDRTVYDGVALFHGDAFQVIAGAPDIGDAGLEATLQGSSARGWSGGSWATDPALIDGALQLALLWTCDAEGGAALPTSIESFRRFSRGLVSSDVRAILVGRERTADRSTSDLVLVDASGTAVAELRGVQMHVLPGSRETPAVRA